MSEAPLGGVLVVDKPAGWTSLDVVAKTRGLTGIRQIGHSGTLDPMATGVLVLCLGKATRLLEYLTGLPKTYQAGITLGPRLTRTTPPARSSDQHPVPELTAEAWSNRWMGFAARSCRRRRPTQPSNATARLSTSGRAAVKRWYWIRGR